MQKREEDPKYFLYSWSHPEIQIPLSLGGNKINKGALMIMLEQKDIEMFNEIAKESIMQIFIDRETEEVTIENNCSDKIQCRDDSANNSSILPNIESNFMRKFDKITRLAITYPNSTEIIFIEKRGYQNSTTYQETIQPVENIPPISSFEDSKNFILYNSHENNLSCESGSVHEHYSIRGQESNRSPLRDNIVVPAIEDIMSPEESVILVREFPEEEKKKPKKVSKKRSKTEIKPLDQKEVKKTTCSICTETVKETYARCLNNHLFCLGCMLEYIPTQSRCPYCRIEMENFRIECNGIFIRNYKVKRKKLEVG